MKCFIPQRVNPAVCSSPFPHSHLLFYCFDYFLFEPADDEAGSSGIQVVSGFFLLSFLYMACICWREMEFLQDIKCLDDKNGFIFYSGTFEEKLLFCLN